MKIMRLFLIIATLLSVVIIYLNRSYAYVYDYQKSHPLTNPNNSNTYTLGNNNQERTLKYIALGDSLTAGVGISDPSQTYPYIIAQKLQEKGKSVVIKNLAVSGARIDDLISFQLPQALKENPTLVTLMIGTNDIHDLKSSAQFEKEYAEIVSQLKLKTQAKIVSINIPYLGSPDLLSPPYNFLVDRQTKEFNKVIAGLSKKMNFQVIDLYLPTETLMKNDKSMYSVDNFHPSEKGYKVWAKIITDNLKAF